MRAVEPSSANGERDEGIETTGGGIDARAARAIRRHLAGGVCIVTTCHGGAFRGTTVTACLAVSMEPLQVLVSLEEDSQMAGWLEASGVCAVNILPWNEQFLADQFAGFTPLASKTFDRIPHTIGASGAPILSASIMWVDCTVTGRFVTGDHVCIVGQALETGNGSGRADDPLVYFLNRYRRLS